MMKKAGLDIGGYMTKAAWNGNTTTFLSAVGERFSGVGLGEVDGIQFESPSCVVGEDAIKYSRFSQHLQARDWYLSDQYRCLYYAALSELTKQSGEVFLVSGHPAKHWKADKDELKSVLSGDHTFQRVGRKPQTVTVTAKITAQGLGSLFNFIMDKNGMIHNESLAFAHLGVIEIGSRTTNLIHLNNLQTVDYETDTFALGGWDMVAVLKDTLTDKYKRISPDDFEVEKYLRAGWMMYDGRRVSIQREIDDAARAVASQVLSFISNKWKSPGAMELILVTGGSSKQTGIGKALSGQFSQSKLDDDPILSNAKGYLKLAQREE